MAKYQFSEQVAFAAAEACDMLLENISDAMDEDGDEASSGIEAVLKTSSLPFDVKLSIDLVPNDKTPDDAELDDATS